jgi:hypothetical protein
MGVQYEILAKRSWANLITTSRSSQASRKCADRQGAVGKRLPMEQRGCRFGLRDGQPESCSGLEVAFEEAGLGCGL